MIERIFEVVTWTIVWLLVVVLLSGAIIWLQSFTG